MNIEIANRLVELRRNRELSQEDLAGKLGISRQAVSKWERAESSPDTDNLIALAKLYGISLDELLLSGVSAAPEYDEVTDRSDMEWEEAERKRRKSMLLRFPYPVFITLCYLVMGFQWGWWHPAWLIFLTIPMYYWYAGMQ